MPDFTGDFDLTLDDKKRLMIPRVVREQIDPVRDGERLYITMGVNRRLSIFTQKQYERHSLSLESALIPNEKLYAFKLLHYGLATQVIPDSVGRITLTENQVKRSGLTKEITLVGVQDRLEIWSRAEWERHLEAALKQFDQVMDSARPVVQKAGTGSDPANV